MLDAFSTPSRNIGKESPVASSFPWVKLSPHAEMFVMELILELGILTVENVVVAPLTVPVTVVPSPMRLKVEEVTPLMVVEEPPPPVPQEATENVPEAFVITQRFDEPSD